MSSDTKLKELDKTLKPISITYLYEGMRLTDDIYDADSGRLLIKSGNTLDKRLLESIKKLNDNRDTIYVSNLVYNELMSRHETDEQISREKLEESTGYAESLDKTIKLLDELSTKDTINQNALNDVAEELSERLELSTPSTITTLINALAPVDEYLQRHCVNVSLLNGLFGRWLDMSKKNVDNLVLIGLMHDCGKAHLPKEILSAPRKLTVTEFEVAKMHPTFTYKLLNEFSEEVRLAASCHHERIGGNGYPHRFNNDKIPFEARITAISDVYDAIVSRRSYKEPRSPFHVLSVLYMMRDEELDEKLIDVFIENMLKQLIGKQVRLSDNTIGIVRAYDMNDIEYPVVEVDGKKVKTSKNCYCISQHTID